LLKETTGAFDGAQTHDLLITSQKQTHCPTSPLSASWSNIT